MIKLLLLLSLAAPVGAQNRAFHSWDKAEMPPINFCASGKFVIFAGSCLPGGKHKDVISSKACNDVVQGLYDGLTFLYPNATVEYQQYPAPDDIVEKLMRPLTLGFIFVGEGDTKGGFVTNPEGQKLYPNISACQAGGYDLFAGFTSHSKYSPEAPARKADTGKVISRHQLLYGGAGAQPGSWSQLCKPRLSLVYPTRTFAVSVKDDIKKLLGALQDAKKEHVLKTLGTICDNCPGHAAAGGPLAQLCPPNSNICRLRKIVPGSEELVLKNYCSALAPTPSRQ
jgi:hypothetical protein